MIRIKDVDSVAPDDPVVTTPASTPTLPKKLHKKKKKLKEIVANTMPEYHSLSKAEYRQRIYDILGHTKHSLSSFLVKPDIFSFQEKDQEEEIILVLRQHWFTNVHWIITTGLMLFVPAVLKMFGLFPNFAPMYQFVTILFWYLITFIYAFEHFLSWYFNVYIITDERVVDVDFNNILVKKFSDAKISMIQDVTSKVIGLIPTMFNYGDILVQTAAEVPEIHFARVPNPEKIIKILQQLRQEEEQEALEGRIN
ncbi:MAG TPA: PH domain-containing protein [Candidatus Woesebacteria bacterium]|nr:PH domain-containing protein [Candidatus Woesebacteria bacterium]HPJ16607.1 PH domain-containing protein [Candidatus Woesebacteria bacterium]